MIVFLTVGLVLGVAGCGTTPPSTSGSPATAAQSPIPTAPAAIPFGQSYAWPDGLRVTVQEPFRYSQAVKGQTGSSFQGGEAFTMKVTVTAPTGQSINPPSDIRIDLTSGDQVAAEFMDAQILGFYTGGPLAPGQVRSYTLGYSIPTAPSGWQAAIQAAPTHPPVFFRSP